MKGSQSDFFLRARQDWIAATCFEDLDESGVFELIRARADAVRRAGGNPWVVFDLDSTLYEVQPRTEAILREWLMLRETRDAWPGIREKLLRLEPGHIGYSLQDTWLALGVDPSGRENADAWRDSRRFWARHFFSPEYLKYDRPYAGAQAIVRDLFEAGIGISYLTARDDGTLREATRRQLMQHGFPIGEPGTALHLKPADESIADFEFKPKAVREILDAQGGVLVASFENEPVNLAAIQARFPEAIHVFMETHCSDRPAPVCSRLYRIRKFG